MVGLLRHRAECSGDDPFVTLDGRTWTFAEAVAMAASQASTFADAGIRRGDRIAILCGNSAEFVATFLGATWMGAVAVPVNTALRGRQLEHVLANSTARLLICESHLVSDLEFVTPGATAIEEVWLVGQPEEKLPGSFAYRDVPAPGDPVALQAVEPNDTAAILYTSGTSGFAKGVCCPHAQFYWWAINNVRILEITGDDVLHTTLPLFHINALTTFMQGLLTGASVVIRPRFSASAFWPELVDSEATITYILGAMAPILLSRPPSDQERGHRVRTALAPAVPADVHEPWLTRTGVRLVDGYGSTESNFVIAAQPHEQRPGLMGYCQPGFKAAVIGDHDEPVPDGQTGELVIRPIHPYSTSTGYFGQPEKTVEAWQNLWFHTGDRVVRHPDGWFGFIDRLSDSIRRRGENISSVEVEHAILSHPDVENVAVFAVPSEFAEDEVMAAVVPRADRDIAAQEIVRHCEPRLAYFAIPRYLEVMEQLPTTSNGKIQKHKLRQRGVTPHTWDLQAANRPKQQATDSDRPPSH